MQTGCGYVIIVTSHIKDVSDGETFKGRRYTDGIEDMPHKAWHNRRQ